jgi:predicted S18 family serine protease
MRVRPVTTILLVLLIASVVVNVYLFSQIGAGVEFPRSSDTALPRTTLPDTQKELLTLSARLESPAVIERAVYDGGARGHVTRRVERIGSMTDISVEIRSGLGRVLVETKPLMGMVFQDAANTAVDVAERETGINMSSYDVIFSVASEAEIPAIDGPSAGALMTLITIAALENREVRGDLTLTGTIESDGSIGAIGGIPDKAKAAKESGKNTILVPGANNHLAQITEREVNYYGFPMVVRGMENIDTEKYIEESTKIDVIYVDTIKDVLKAALV